MKTIIWLLIIIGWSVLKARRKAMREQRKMQAMRAAPPSPEQPAQDRTDKTYTTYDPGDQQLPPELQPLLDYRRQRDQQAPSAEETTQPQSVDEIVQPVAAGAYDIEPETKPKIVFDRDSLRTFFVMREVLGPPRFRKHFRPRMKAQE